jgi:hypothetical protein
MNMTNSITSDPAVQEVMQLPETSDWLKMVIDTGCERDPVDVLNDLERAQIVFNSAFDRLIAAQPSR